MPSRAAASQSSPAPEALDALRKMLEPLEPEHALPLSVAAPVLAEAWAYAACGAIASPAARIAEMIASMAIVLFIVITSANKNI